MVATDSNTLHSITKFNWFCGILLWCGDPHIVTPTFDVWHPTLSNTFSIPHLVTQTFDNGSFLHVARCNLVPQIVTVLYTHKWSYLWEITYQNYKDLTSIQFVLLLMVLSVGSHKLTICVYRMLWLIWGCEKNNDIISVRSH